VCVCVCEREREGHTDKDRDRVCVYVCLRESEGEKKCFIVIKEENIDQGHLLQKFRTGCSEYFFHMTVFSTSLMKTMFIKFNYNLILVENSLNYLFNVITYSLKL